MPTVDHVDLEVGGAALSATPDTQVGVSASLSNGVEYLVVGHGNASSTGADGTDVDSTFLIGGTVYARSAGETDTFSPPGAMDSAANGGTKPIAVATVYTAGASDELELESWSGDGTGEASMVCTAIDLSLIPDSGLAQARWHQETANNDTIVDTPTTGYEVVGTALTFTPNRAGEFKLFITAEIVNDGTAASTDEVDCRVMVDGVVLDGSEYQADIGDRTDAVICYAILGREVTLTAAEHDIEVELNGTSSGGNLGVRRIRIHAIEAAALGGSSQDSEPGETVTTSDASELDQTTDASLTIGNGTDDFLIFWSGQKQVSYWSECHFLLAGTTEEPTEGFGVGAGDDFGTAATDDMPLEVSMAILSAPASSTSVAMRLTKKPFAAGSNLYGGDVNRTANGDLYLSSLVLNFQLDVDISGSSAGTSTVTGTLTVPGGIEGSSEGTSTVTGTLTGTGALASQGDPLAQYDDTFPGEALSAQWEVFLPAEVDRVEVGGGEVNVEPTEGGLDGSHWFDDRDGILHHIGDTITGAFDFRGRVRVRDSAGTASPPSAVGEFRFAGIAAHDPDRATEFNYVHTMLGSDPNGTNRVEWKTTDSSDSEFDSIAGSAPLDYDLRIVRTEADLQVFELYYRRTDDGEDLDSDVGWTLLNTIDRDDNATPPRTTATNMPAAVQLGWSGGYAGPQLDHDIQSWVEEIRLRTLTPDGARGTSTATATGTAAMHGSGASAGTSTVTGTLTGVGALAGSSAGTSTVTGTLFGGGDLIEGSSEGTSTCVGTLTGIGALVGASAGTSTVTASLSGAVIIGRLRASVLIQTVFGATVRV